MARGFAAIGIINSKTEANVGGAMRAAACYGAAAIVVEGARYRVQASDTTKAWRHIPLFHVDDVWKMVPFDCVPVAIEFRQEAVTLPRFSHPERAFYIFGPEDGDVPERIVSRCANLVTIPTLRCMNLAATVNVVLYDRLAKHNRDARGQVEAVELALDETIDEVERLANR